MKKLYTLRRMLSAALLLLLMGTVITSCGDDNDDNLNTGNNPEANNVGGGSSTNDSNGNSGNKGNHQLPDIPTIDVFSDIDYDEMVYVEGGTFLMGAQNSDPTLPNYEESSHISNEPVHAVTLSSYYIGRYEVTQELWEYVMSYSGKAVDGTQMSPEGPYFHGSFCGPYSDRGDNGKEYPVYNISYNEIAEYFLPRLNSMTGRNFRLPTEAEWEYAARGGQMNEYTRTHTSPTQAVSPSATYYLYAGSNNLDDVACYGLKHANNPVQPVGTKLPNELGLYDMSGNAAEMCNDFYDSYSASEQYNPKGPDKGRVNIGNYTRVKRGGSSYTQPSSSGISIYFFVSCRLQFYGSDYHDNSNLGFRLVMDE